MFSFIYRKAAAFFLSKSARGKLFNIGRPDPSVDYYDIYLHLKEDKPLILLTGIDDKYVYGVVGLDRLKVPIAITLKTFPWKDVTGYHYYITHFSVKGGLIRHTFRRIFFLPKLEWKIKCRRDSNLNAVNDRYQVLKILRDRIDQKSEIGNLSMMEEIYGSRIHKSTRASEFQTVLRLIVDGLVDDECIEISNDLMLTYQMSLEPKGLKLLAEYEIANRRHEDAEKSARTIRWATITMAAAVVFQGLEAAVNLFNYINIPP